MNNSKITTAMLALLLPAVAHAQSAAVAPIAADVGGGSDAAQLPGATAEDIIVTGTRQQGRTQQQSTAPVDVISATELQKTGEQNVFDALNKVLPSLELPPVGFDTAGLVRAARLRGLSPDDTLVLIDGKRRHISANINADIGPVGGSDPVDLDMIPISLIDHIEVLRDGAAAQYGSDAIAGVINIILKHADHGTTAYAQEGATYVQDGFTNNIGVSQGIALGGKGYFDVAGDYRYHDHTNRDGDFPSEAATGSQLTPAFVVPNKNSVSQIEGDPRYNLANLGYNAAYTFIPEVTLYSFATYGYRHSEAFENYRDPEHQRHLFGDRHHARHTVRQPDRGRPLSVRLRTVGGHQRGRLRGHRRHQGRCVRQLALRSERRPMAATSPTSRPSPRSTPTTCTRSASRPRISMPASTTTPNRPPTSTSAGHSTLASSRRR